MTEHKTVDSRLINAMRNNDIEEVRRLIADGTDLNAVNGDGWTPLHIAVCGDHAASAYLLIEKGADVNAKDNYSSTPLHKACWHGGEEIVRLLLKAGADVNAGDYTGATSLHIACKEGYADIACSLLSHGADVNAQDNNGVTPLDKFKRFADRELVLRWYGENCPEAYFTAFCESKTQGPG